LNFISDVTDRMVAKDLVDQERSKSEFYLDLLGHDIGNLMQGISAWIEMARGQKGLDGKMQLYLDQSWLLSERSKRLVKNVLIISRIRDREPELEEIRLVPVLKRSMGEIVNNFPKKEVTIDLVDNSLDPVIMAEPIVEEMFYNLIHNAVKFQKGESATVKIILERSKQVGVIVSVMDRGPGINDEQKKGIFKRFKDLTGRKYTGIGLALTKELVDRYRGSIEVLDNLEDGEVAGACFRITLPCSSL
jgi:signal transduction histidine kinase